MIPRFRTHSTILPAVGNTTPTLPYVTYSKLMLYNYGASQWLDPIAPLVRLAVGLSESGPGSCTVWPASIYNVDICEALKATRVSIPP
jgi:hypothetical protein